jgi:hypothetical protein
VDASEKGVRHGEEELSSIGSPEHLDTYVVRRKRIADRPFPRTEQLTATITGTLASQDLVCFPVSDLAGQFTASVAPEVPIEFSTGDCDGPVTPPLAHGDRGYVTATLPEGTKRVRIYNPSTGFPSFQLSLTYPIAF